MEYSKVTLDLGDLVSSEDEFGQVETSGFRVHGPFADRLAIRYCFKDSGYENAKIVPGGAYLARITLGLLTA